jgi:SAM-dependent methyltransferase
MKKTISKLKVILREWQAKLIDHERYQLSAEETSSVRVKISPLLAEIFGYHALLYSTKAKKLVDENLSVRHSFILANESQSNVENEQPSILCRYTELPLSSDTIDLIVIPEVLQQAQFPHQILREVERTLIPEGHIILLVENVFSWQSMKNRILIFIAEPHFKTRVISRSRISDWFRLLGLEICREIPVSTSVDYSTDLQNKSKQRKNNWLENFADLRKIFFSSYYIILAKKKVSTLTPIRSSWRSNRKLVNPRFAEPSVRITVDKILNQK